MGNQPKVQQKTQEEVLEALKIVMLHQKLNFTQKQLQSPLQIFLTDIASHHPFPQQPTGILHVRTYLIRMFYCPLFAKQLLKMLKHLIEKLEQINKKSLMLLNLSQIEYVQLLANFILFSTNDSILALFDSLTIRSDIDESSLEVLKEIQARENQTEVCENLVQRLADQQIEAFEKVLRLTLYHFISARQQTLTRSQQTLVRFRLLEESLFMLYTKLYFAQPELYREDANHSEGSREREHFKKNLIIGAYFLACGNNYMKPSIFQTAVIFLYSLMNIVQNGDYKPIKTLPSHLFKQIPVVPSNSLYDYITCNVLHALHYIKEGNSTYIRFTCNRIQALKLIEKLLIKFELHSENISYYMEQLCLQVKIGQIQRACLQKIARQYLKNLNRDGLKSQIIEKFLKSSNIKYNLKVAGKEIKVSSDELLTELEDSDDIFMRQYIFYSEKYLYESIIMQPMGFNFNDRSIWNQILPSIIENKEDERIYQSMNKQEKKKETKSVTHQKVQEQKEQDKLQKEGINVQKGGQQGKQQSQSQQQEIQQEAKRQVEERKSVEFQQEERREAEEDDEGREKDEQQKSV